MGYATHIKSFRKKLKECMEILREYKFELLEDLQQKGYAIRSWVERGVPTVETLKIKNKPR